MNGLTLAYQVAGLAWAEAGPTQAAVHAGSAHGFSTAQIIDLMRAGLATARAERFVVGGGRIEVARVRITEAGKRACAKYE